MQQPAEYIPYQPTLDPSFTTIPEAAQILRVSQRTVYRWVKSGALPCFKQGNVTRIATDALRKFIAENSGGLLNEPNAPAN